MSSINVSAVIIAKDAEATIRLCLQSLADLDEVIVYENGSEDDTANIAASFSNVKVIAGEFIGFGPTKNSAAEHARNAWVFSLDSDEIATPELIDSISAIDFSNEELVYSVNRHNYFQGRHVKHGGWGNDWLTRIYSRNQFAYNDAMVHEKIDVSPAATRKLIGALRHEAVSDIGQFLSKINRYSDIRQANNAKAYGPFVSLSKAIWAFFRSFVLYRGFLDGWRGMVIAYSNATGVFFRCMKAYARDRAAVESPDDSS
ncbi:MAG: glycosyltransferase family 2 protein [Gammaproteobacteria bacterium]